MANAKKHLLVLHFWNMTFDVVFNLLNTPILFFPSASFIMLGYGEDIGIPPRFQYYLIQVAICVIAVAMIGLYENRFSSISTNPYRIEKNWIRVILHIFNYCVAFLVVIPPYFRSVDLNETRKQLLEMNPCPPDEFFTARFDVISDQPSYVVVFMFTQTMIVLPQTTFFSKYTAYLLVYKPNESVSEATRKMQRKFLSSLMLQCNIPHILLFIPVLYIWFSAMTDYYSPVMSRNASCGDLSFFASPSYVTMFTHVISIVSIPVSIYAMYCILYLTPKKMSGTKKHLVILHVWNMLFDILFNLLNSPLLFFPSAAFVMLGYGYDIGIPPRFQYYLIQVIVCVVGVAMIGLFENRFSSIVTNPYRIEREWIRVLLHVFNYCTAFFVVVPPYLTDVDLEPVRQECLKIVPCPTSEFYTDRFAVVTDQPHYITIFMFIQFLIILPQTTFFSTYTSHLLVDKSNKSVSELTRRMQHKYLISLKLQCNIPHITLLIPVLYIWFSSWANYYSAAYNNHIVVLVSLHGLCATTCIIVIHKPYRDNFMSIFGIVKAKSTPVSIMQVTERSKESVKI